MGGFYAINAFISLVCSARCRHRSQGLITNLDSDDLLKIREYPLDRTAGSEMSVKLILGSQEYMNNKQPTVT